MEALHEVWLQSTHKFQRRYLKILTHRHTHIHITHDGSIHVNLPGVLILLQIVGQGPAVLAASAGPVGYIFYIFHPSSLSNVLSFGRRLNMTEIL